MCRYILFVAVVMLALLGTGCSHLAVRDVKVEPVSFTHPDEFVSGQGFMALAGRTVNWDIA